jgi:hypothetical protein
VSPPWRELGAKRGVKGLKQRDRTHSRLQVHPKAPLIRVQRVGRPGYASEKERRHFQLGCRWRAAWQSQEGYPREVEAHRYSHSASSDSALAVSLRSNAFYQQAAAVCSRAGNPRRRDGRPRAHELTPATAGGPPCLFLRRLASPLAASLQSIHPIPNAQRPRINVGVSTILPHKSRRAR